MALQWKTPLFLWPFSIVMENIVENVPELLNPSTINGYLVITRGFPQNPLVLPSLRTHSDGRSRPWWTLAVASAERGGCREETHEVSVKTWGILWKFHGNFIGISWEFHGIYRSWSCELLDFTEHDSFVVNGR